MNKRNNKNNFILPQSKGYIQPEEVQRINKEIQELKNIDNFRMLVNTNYGRNF